MDPSLSTVRLNSSIEIAPDESWSRDLNACSNLLGVSTSSALTLALKNSWKVTKPFLSSSMKASRVSSSYALISVKPRDQNALMNWSLEHMPSDVVLIV